MAKTKISEYDSTAANNTDIDSINIAEGMAPSNVNNAIRELMAHLKDGLGAGTPVFLDQTNTRLGVGTTSPVELLEVNSTGSSTAIEISAGQASTTTGEAKLVLRSLHSSSGTTYSRSEIASLGVGGGDSDLIFRTTTSSAGPVEHMRLDSEGHLLVNTTDTTVYNNGADTSADTGITLRTDYAGFARYNGTPMYVNRTGSDGDIITVNRSGAAIGSIGVQASDNLFISGNSTHAGITFGDAQVVPYKNGAVSNGAIDLGGSSSRFRELFLSNGVYLGGTGASNLMSDYETGNWTPDLQINNSSSGITYTSRSGAYVKIGELVFIEGDIQLSNKGSSSGAVKIDNLPFNVDDRTSGTSLDGGAGLCAFQSNTSGVHSPIGLIGVGGTDNIDMRVANVNGGDISQALLGTNITNSFSIRFSLTYRAA